MRSKLLLLGMNYWPLAHLVLVASPWVALDASPGAKLGVSLALFFLLPPLLCRILLALFGEPPRRIPAFSRPFFVWWATYQLQAVFLRVPMIEELMRIVPGLYATWLRLWGSRVGRLSFWSPGSRVLDRPFADIGDEVMVGYDAGFTSHLFVKDAEGKLELVFGRAKAGDRSLLGGRSGILPGSELAPGEMLPADVVLIPYSVWKDGRRQRDRSPEAGTPAPST
ncbi:MAG TPA: hypothetical protein VM598_05200 [Bdellovibrionota bacterium]|nr:hypothetical protein [Bdellovibrionota bacterium]